MKYANIVVGSGYGDCGKGKAVDFLSHQFKREKSLVIRYNGGSQAAHRVVTPSNQSHIFSHIGSGTYNNVPTFLSEDFIVHPASFNPEYDSLCKYLVKKPIVYIDNQCRVTTPYDILLNLIIEDHRTNRHGSCGFGIHETILRHKVIPVTIRELYDMIDNNQIYDLLSDIKQYAYQRLEELNVPVNEQIKDLLEKDFASIFIRDLKIFFGNIILSTDLVIDHSDVLIFEGAQGLLLSEKHQPLPHLTPSDPGIAIPLSICQKHDVSVINVSYVTRAYSTRHGNGPLDYENTMENLKLNIDFESNQENANQGKFRFAALNIEKIKKAIHDDFRQSIEYPGMVTRELIINCVDQLDMYKGSVNTTEVHNYLRYIMSNIGIKSGYAGIGPTRNDMYRLIF